MVVCEAALVALGTPGADRAVIDGLGVGARYAGLEVGEQPPAQPAVVGRELGEAEAVLLAGAEDDVDQLGLGALGAGEELAVETELEDEVGLRAAGELGVGDLVAPGAELGGALDPEEEVGVASQPVREEGRLEDHLGAGAHRLDRLLGSFLDGAVLVDLDHTAPLLAEGGEVGRLVLIALAGDQHGGRVAL